MRRGRGDGGRGSGPLLADRFLATVFLDSKDRDSCRVGEYRPETRGPSTTFGCRLTTLRMTIDFLRLSPRFAQNDKVDKEKPVPIGMAGEVA
jgi:hypothetical protein